MTTFVTAGPIFGAFLSAVNAVIVIRNVLSSFFRDWAVRWTRVRICLVRLTGLWYLAMHCLILAHSDFAVTMCFFHVCVCGYERAWAALTVMLSVSKVTRIVLIVQISYECWWELVT